MKHVGTRANPKDVASQEQLTGIVASQIHAATAKTTPADADELPIADSAASWSLKKLTFANLKAWISGLFVSKAGDTMTGFLKAREGLAVEIEKEVVFYDFSSINRASMKAESSGAVVINVGVTDSQPRLRIYTNGDVCALAGAIGYGFGAGGTVTQPTSKSTAVTLNKPCGRIITHDQIISAGSDASFTLHNSLISESDVVILNHKSPSAQTYVVRTAVLPGGGGVYIFMRNQTGAGVGQVIEINFAVIKGSAS